MTYCRIQSHGSVFHDSVVISPAQLETGRWEETYTFPALSKGSLIASVLLFALLSLNTDALLAGCGVCQCRKIMSAPDVITLSRMTGAKKLLLLIWSMKVLTFLWCSRWMGWAVLIELHWQLCSWWWIKKTTQLDGLGLLSSTWSRG